MNALEIKRDEKKGKIWSHVRGKWLLETPEETVRQQYLLVLVNEYGFTLDQIAEEMVLTGRGSASARADFVLWRSARDKADDNAPFIIVECKSDNVAIKPQDYDQGENYARICGAPFFVTHNSRETKYWRIKKDKVPGYTEEIENIPHGDATDKEIEELLAKLRVFKEKEFADLLHKCHNIIRNREKKDPAAAFDEIAKVLFIKVYVERSLLTRRSKTNLFTVDVLKGQIAENPLDNLFQETKRAYAADKIFEDDERINLKPATGEAIVKELEKYNLSDTSEDVKGVAFERFLGRTFRGEIGQFFTPRTIVEFMVHMVDPQEDEIVCDPASGSGGFLIRVFEIVREKILADADREYNVFKAGVEKNASLTEEQRAKTLQGKFTEVQKRIDQQHEGSRLWKLSNRCIYGTDANDRMARTSKMNMIMHGDGHGGVHHHDGFLNVNGIFEGRFDMLDSTFKCNTITFLESCHVINKEVPSSDSGRSRHDHACVPSPQCAGDRPHTASLAQHHQPRAAPLQERRALRRQPRRARLSAAPPTLSSPPLACPGHTPLPIRPRPTALPLVVATADCCQTTRHARIHTSRSGEPRDHLRCHLCPAPWRAQARDGRRPAPSQERTRTA